MTASVTVKLGNLFDGPADVVVLPCSTNGTVTGFVARSLSQYFLPHPAAGMQLGDVEILPFTGGENIAQFVAFAASVKSMTSSLSAIEEIALKLGGYTNDEPSARVIATPLLGAGAGGLESEAVVSALNEGFKRSAHDAANLIIHVLHKDVFNLLRGHSPKIANTPTNNVRVFVSHTSTTQEAIEWVKELAIYLMNSGIEARLDKFHLRRGMDLPQWMTNELALAQKVIVVCDETYKKKADARLGGVGWETMIIQGDVLKLPPDSTKYQVVVRAEDMNKAIPIYLQTKYAFHARPSDRKESFREELVRELLDLPPDECFGVNQFSV
jgi:SEFIR domain-containing protein